MIATAPTNGYHPHQQQNIHMQQAALYAASDPATAALLHQVNATNVSPGAAAATANGLIPPQQRTDRLQVCVLIRS